MPLFEQESILHTDLYQLSMMQAHLEEGLTGPAAFEFFVRRLPPRRNFLVAAGLAQALDYLRSLRASADDILWLKETGRFSNRFLGWLAEEVDARLAWEAQA